MNILLVEQSRYIRDNLITYLELNIIFDTVLSADNVKETLDIMSSTIMDIVLFDLQLPDRNGFDIVTFANDLPKRPLLIMVSDFTQSKYKKSYEQLGIDYFFDKSRDLEKLKRFLSELTGHNRINQS
jgi:DNA-binding NarL/FixJ family response regulator